MGMFDYLTINGFVITGVSSEVAKYFNEGSFQTKSLYRYMEMYKIRKNGCLYRREEDDEGEFWVKIIKTIEIEFHESIDDYCLSFIAEYKRGELVKIVLNEFETIKKRQERMKKYLT